MRLGSIAGILLVFERFDVDVLWTAFGTATQICRQQSAARPFENEQNAFNQLCGVLARVGSGRMVWKQDRMKRSLL